MYVDGEVKLIDLDDTFTKYFLFANRILERDSIGGLDESIKTLFGEYSKKMSVFFVLISG